MPITPAEYKKLINNQDQSKIITLPSGAEFEIRKLTVLDYIEDGALGLKNVDSYKNIDAGKANFNADQYKEIVELQSKMIIKSVVAPKVTKDPTPDSISISEIVSSMDDFIALSNEISSFSFGGEQKLKNFRDEEKSADTA